MSDKVTVSIYKTKCKLCGKEFQGTKEMLKKQISYHIDNYCEMAETYRDWEKKGIFKEMMTIYRRKGLEQDLKKLMKKTKSIPDELIDILEDLK